MGVKAEGRWGSMGVWQHSLVAWQLQQETNGLQAWDVSPLNLKVLSPLFPLCYKISF